MCGKNSALTADVGWGSGDNYEVFDIYGRYPDFS